MQISETKLTTTEVLSLLKKSSMGDNPNLSEENFAEKLANKAFFLLAKDKDEIIGFCAFYKNTEGKFIYISLLWVDSNYRRKGIGKQIIQYLHSLTYSLYNEIRLEVLKENSLAIKFYQRESFFVSEDRENKYLLICNKEKMTECERIIKEGILPESFFKPETRCDFYVDENRKKIWAVELDLLLKFDSVCKKHGLKYMLYGGSLLGVIRHKGFIPWDDDIDVCMFREDYEKFITLSDEFTNQYFLQTPYTDKDYFYTFAKLRNSNTTAISKMFAHRKFNQGIFLDIFPIDVGSLVGAQERYDRIKYLLLENSTYMRIGNPNLDEKNIERCKNWSRIDPLKAYEEIQAICMTFYGKETDYIASCSCCFLPWHKNFFNKADAEEIIYAQCESFQVPIPKGYHNLLSTQFGDYMQFPPIDKRDGGHNAAIFDPDKPYTEYLI